MAATVKKAPRSPLSREAIVARAIAVAGADGLEAVTIRRLATDSGVTPMALYWHFRDKDLLLDGVVESVLQSVELPAPTEALWHEQLEVFLHRLLDALRPHPAIAPLVSNRILLSEAGLLMTEHVLGLTRAGGFSPEEASDIACFLLAAVVSLVTAEPGPQSALGPDERDAAVRSTRAALEGLDPARFPHIIASAPSLSVCSNEDDYFDRGIAMLVRGTRDLQSA